jgi:hypothetical protein
MTGPDIRAARGTLGALWGLGRPLSMSELGRALRLSAGRPNQTVEKWETGKAAVTGPVSVAVEALLSGWRPAHFDEIVIPRGRPVAE